MQLQGVVSICEWMLACARACRAVWPLGGRGRLSLGRNATDMPRTPPPPPGPTSPTDPWPFCLPVFPTCQGEGQVPPPPPGPPVRVCWGRVRSRSQVHSGPTLPSTPWDWGQRSVRKCPWPGVWCPSAEGFELTSLSQPPQGDRASPPAHGARLSSGSTEQRLGSLGTAALSKHLTWGGGQGWGSMVNSQ